jgi:hypothetical protein
MVDSRYLYYLCVPRTGSDLAVRNRVNPLFTIILSPPPQKKVNPGIAGGGGESRQHRPKRRFHAESTSVMAPLQFLAKRSCRAAVFCVV